MLALSPISAGDPTSNNDEPTNCTALGFAGAKTGIEALQAAEGRRSAL